MKRHFLPVISLIFMALALTVVHHSIIDQPYVDARVQLHYEIIEGSAVSPYRYRVLIPFAAEAVIRLLLFTTDLSPLTAFKISYVLVEAGLFITLLIALYVFLCQWLNRGLALTGVLAVAAVLPLTFLEQYLQPWTYLETSLLALTLAATRTRSKELLGAICVLLASLNRESGIFAVAAFFLVTFNFDLLMAGIEKSRLNIDWRSGLTSMGLLAIWLTVFLGLRFFRGESPQIHTPAEIWAINTSAGSLVRAGVNWVAFSGLLWLLAVPGLRFSPVFFQRLVWLIPFYLATVLVWGIWTEVRLLLPLYTILLIPALLYLHLVLKKEILH